MTTPAQLIDKQIAELSDWRGERIAHLRKLIHEVGPGLKEDWKWDTAVWSQKSLVLAVGAFKDHVKINFFQGTALSDPKHLFNAGLDAKKTRAIDLAEGDALDKAGLKELIGEAVVYNMSGKK